jgi:hypothetical protein
MRRKNRSIGCLTAADRVKCVNAHRDTRMPSRRTIRPLALALALTCAAATVSRAEIRVDGTAQSVRVTASGAAVADVLSAIANNFGMTYRTSVALDGPADQSYAGSLRQVVSRLLDGYVYVIKTEGGTAEIVIFGRRGTAAVPPPPKRPPAEGILSRWR